MVYGDYLYSEEVFYCEMIEHGNKKEPGENS